MSANQDTTAPAALGPRDPDTHLDQSLIPIGLFFVAGLVYSWVSNDKVASLAYFVPLADAFLHGRLGLTEAPGWLNELVPAANGLYYVVYPPAPAILLLPVVAIFGPDMNQAWPSVILGAVNVALVSAILRRMGVERMPRVVLSLVFAFGTIVWYSAQEGTSWHFAHVVALFFTLLAILAAMFDRHPALIALLFAGALMSRLPVAMAFPFFIAYVLDRADRARTGDPTPFGHLGGARPRAWHTRPDLRVTLSLAWPAALVGVIVVAVYAWYNAARFGSPFENGYAMIPGLLQEAQYAHGFFSIVNIPRILYAMVLSGPVQVGDFPWVQPPRLGGLSILLTTPLFLWSIKARRPDWFGLGAWLSILAILVPVLTHADPGGQQFGFRYAQDFYPFLLLLTVRGLGGRISFEAWVAIAVGFTVNAWGMVATRLDWFA